jgi:hypothetical protein
VAGHGIQEHGQVYISHLNPGLPIYIQRSRQSAWFAWLEGIHALWLDPMIPLRTWSAVQNSLAMAMESRQNAIVIPEVIFAILAGSIVFWRIINNVFLKRLFRLADLLIFLAMVLLTDRLDILKC